MISTPHRRVHVYTEKENETPNVISNKGKDHGGVKSTIHHRTPLTEINGQKLAVYDGDQIRKRLIKTTKESALTPGEKKGRRSLKLDYVKQSLDQPKCNDNKEETGIQQEAERIQKEHSTLATGSSLSSLETVISTSEPGHSLTSCDDFDSATFSLISSSVEPIHCNSSSVISLTSINSEDFVEEFQQHDESFLIEEFVSDVISKAQKIVSEETVSGSDEASQAEKGLNLFQDTETDDTDLILAEEQRPQSQEVNFTDVNIIEEEIVEEAEDQSFPLLYLEESASREEDFLELVSIRSSPALEEVLESSGEERLLTYEDSCLSQDLEVGVEDVSEISLQNFFQLQEEMPEGEGKMQSNLFLQLTPSKILSSAPQIVPVFKHAVFAKSEYEVALCSGNLWHSKTTNEVVTSPIRYVEQGTLTSPRLLASSSGDGVAITDRLTALHNIKGNYNDSLAAPVQTSSGCYTSPLSRTNHSQMTSALGVSEETSMTPPCLHVRSCNTSPVKLTDQSTVMSPLEVKHQSCNTSSIEKLSKETETVHLITHDTAVGDGVVTTNDSCTHMTPSKSHDKECGTTPMRVCSVSQMTTPVSSCESSTHMTPSQCNDKECGTSPLRVCSVSQVTTPVPSCDSSTHMTPSQCNDKECGTSPLRVCSVSQVTTPVSSCDSSTHMTPSQSNDKECGTSPLRVCSVSQMTTPVSSCDSSTHMTPSQSNDKECGTSPTSVCNVSQMTTPVSSENAATCTSPLSTSPLRLSNFTRKSESSMALMDQMKSSYISNKLLRREVSSLKKHRTLWEEHLQKEQQEMRKRLSMIKHKETEIHDAKQAVKASVQSEIDDLLSQVGQQLTQIGELEQNVQQKDEEIANLKRTNEERKKKYCDEVKELQDDLCLAYKQHEIEVTELKDKLEKQASYEKLYHKLMAKNRMLEEEALCFTELKESLMKATEIQKKMSVLSETFTAVQSLFQQTLAEKSALNIKQKELDEKDHELLKKFQKSSEETDHLIRETERLQEVVDEEKKKSILVETERERLQDELVASQQENNSLQTSLKETLEEIEMLKSVGEELRGEIMQLKDAELLLRASHQDREEKLESEMSDVRDVNMKRKEKLDEMDEVNKRLTSELETMKTKYSEAVRTEDSLKVQLKNEQESKEFVQTEFESMEEYAKELETKVKTSKQDLDNCKTSLQDAQNAIQNYELMVQNIGEHLRSCKNELEHTRQKAHHMIMHQGAQISSASDALQDLTNRLRQSFPEIENDVAMGLQDTENPTSQVQEETQAEGNSQSSSLVFSILNSPLPMRDRPEPCSRGSVLNTSSSITSHTKDSISPVEYSSSQLQERNLIGQSANSAFSRVYPVSSFREEADLSLGEHVQKINDLFNVLTEKIFQKMHISNQKLAELEGKSEQLMADLQKSRKQYDSYVLQLQNQLQDSELQVRHLRQQLQAACSKTYDDQEKLHLALREARTAELCTSQNNEQKLTIIRMQKEVEKLVKELKMAEYQKQMCQEQVTSLTNLISNKGSPDIKQTMALLSKVSADYTKLKKEMRIVEENWQKAEAEVKSLDSLFNHCVKLLEKVPQHVRDNDKNLQTLTGILLSP